RRAVRESPVAVVVEEAQRNAIVLARNHHVEQAVIIEIVNNQPARHAATHQTRGGRNIRQTYYVLFRRQQRRVDPVLRRNTIRITAREHRRHVQKPSRIQIVGRAPQHQEKIFGRLCQLWFLRGRELSWIERRRENEFVIKRHARLVQI